jgi:hypothetical protein
MSDNEPAVHPDDPPATAPDLSIAPEADSDDSAFDLLAPPEVLAVPAEVVDPIERRRADIDAKQAVLARVLAGMKCEGALLLMPAHVAWFTGGLNVRGLIPDTERPGVYTTGRARWLICGNTDTQRLFDEELDQLGFQLKEWQWPTGRAALLGELVAGKAVAADRPFPSLPLINDRLRAEVRPLRPFDRERYVELGQVVARAVEATARTFNRGETEAEIAGQVAHRLHRHGAEAVGVSVTADGRGRAIRRAGFTQRTVEKGCVIQATGLRDGLYVTTSRTVSFGPVAPDLRAEHDTAIKLAAVYQSLSTPGQSVAAATEAGQRLTDGGPFEFEWRHGLPGYGTGWFPAEELRRGGLDERFADGWPVVWQARVGAAAVVDSVIVGSPPTPVTPPADWPFKRVKLKELLIDVPDILVRDA